MTATAVIFAISCLTMITLVLTKPSVSVKNYSLAIYWAPVLAGALLLWILNVLSFDEIVAGLTAHTAVNPLKILTLFLSMSFLSVFLDEIGFFRYLASKTLTKSGGSLTKLFFLLYAVVSVLTVFTSNDIIILTFTPFICYFAKNARINPIPFLITEFVAANTWSMMFIIGNPTNIYLATSANIDFLSYFSIMWLPTVFGGTVSLFILYFLFRKELKTKANPEIIIEKIEDKPLLIIGLIHLVGCTILLVISSYINLEMWLISLCFAISLAIIALIYRICRKQRPVAVLAGLFHLPWELVPFVLSMFVFVLALNKVGITASISKLLAAGNPILNYGVTSLLTANIINNIPMSVLFSQIAQSVPALYASIIGSNIGAFLTPIGALAGIMWLGILKKRGIKFSFSRFVGYGILTAFPTLFASLCGLILSLII